MSKWLISISECGKDWNKHITYIMMDFLSGTDVFTSNRKSKLEYVIQCLKTFQLTRLWNSLPYKTGHRSKGLQFDIRPVEKTGMQATQHIVCGTSTKTTSKYVPISCIYLSLPACLFICLSVYMSTYNNLKTTTSTVIKL